MVQFEDIVHATHKLTSQLCENDCTLCFFQKKKIHITSLYKHFCDKIKDIYLKSILY